ncbi:MAG: N-acetylmuramoyl-L-alanine amidase [Bacilli bacterium]|nr:N-acetylmuramoyl-L-alanine amidase [Bacilli bacterium]
MKKIIFIFLLCLVLFITSTNASLPLSGKFIVIDAGHGGKDQGTSYQNILEKNINLEVSKELEKQLIKNGASVLLTREGDYDLSTPNASRRKRSDFNNRIDYINASSFDLYLSIHMNYLDNQKYYGAQVFYYDEINKKLAETIQSELNTISYPRSIKKMPDIYMYQYLKMKGVLIECGFISNEKERKQLLTKEYQEKLAKTITKAIINFYN